MTDMLSDPALDVLARLEILRGKLESEGQYVRANTVVLAIDEITLLRGDEAGWLIEANESDPSEPLYWAGSLGDERDRWTYDHFAAVRLSRKRDAEAVCNEVLRGYAVRICEHSWS